MAPSTDIGELLLRVQAVVFPRRIRVKQFFIDFDPLKCGRVTKEQFVRCMINMGVAVDATECEALAEHFTETDRAPQEVNYARFSEAIDEVFTTSHLEGHPTAEVPKPGACLPETFIPRPVEDEEYLSHLLHRVALLAHTRGVVLKYCFQDFDRARDATLTVPRCGGKITDTQFRRNFPFIKDFNDKDVSLLIERYKTDHGEVNYQAMIDDISEAQGEIEAPPVPTSPLVLRPDHTQWARQSHSLIEKIQAVVVERRLRVRDPFQDFDPLRKGVCTPGGLRTAFTVLRLQVSAEEFDQLMTEYSGGDGLFNYDAFCSDIDAAFVTTGLERTPLARVSMPDANSTQLARRNLATKAPWMEEKVKEIEEKVRYRVRVRRMLIRNAFQDHDRVRRGLVTKTQFARVMLTELTFDLTEAEVDLLAEAYCDRGNHFEVNYVDFCKSCDAASEIEAAAVEQITAPYQKPRASKYFSREGQIYPLPGGRQSPCDSP